MTALLLIIIFSLLYLLTAFIISGMLLYLDRQPIPKRPNDYGMKYESLNIKTRDGINISGWLIPGNSNKLVIMTHVGGLTKYGSTTSFKSPSKLYNQEIEFIKTAKHLHHAGYDVIGFDFRNHGESARSPNNGLAGVGLEEYKDVVAVLDFIKQRPDLKDKEIGFLSFCLGANSTIIAMSKEPTAFEKVKCLVAVQPISYEVFIRTYLSRLITPLGAACLLPAIKLFMQLRGSHPLEKMSPKEYVRNIKVPTLYVQTRNDPWTDLNDIKSFYDLTTAEKDFYWIEGTKHRFEGYAHFQDHPTKMLEWFKRYL